MQTHTHAHMSAGLKEVDALSLEYHMHEKFTILAVFSLCVAAQHLIDGLCHSVQRSGQEVCFQRLGGFIPEREAASGWKVKAKDLVNLFALTASPDRYTKFKRDRRVCRLFKTHSSTYFINSEKIQQNVFILCCSTTSKGTQVVLTAQTPWQQFGMLFLCLYTFTLFLCSQHK